MKMLFLAIAVLIGMASAQIVGWNVQSMYWSEHAHLNIGLDCQGNTTCELGIVPGQMNCSFALLDVNHTESFIKGGGLSTASVSGPITWEYSGPFPLEMMVEHPHNGFYRLNATCTSGLVTEFAASYYNVHGEDWWIAIAYSVLALLPFTLMLVSLWIVVQGPGAMPYAFGAMGAVAIKYMVMYITVWSPLAELGQFDFLPVVLGIIVIVFEMYRNMSRMGGRYDGKQGKWGSDI